MNWTRRDFELTSISCCRAFRIYLRRKEVWIFKETTSAKSLYDAFKKKTLTSWTEDEIKRFLSEMRFTFYLIKEFLKAFSDELLQRQKHEVSIDHEEFMTERYTSSFILSRSFASSSSSLSVNQSIKHSQTENQMFSSLAISQGLLIIDNSNHVLITKISKHFDKRSDESSTPLISVNQSIEQSKRQSSMRHSSRESSIARNFLRQSFSSSQSENFYIRQSSSKNSYIRLSENSYTFIIHRQCDIEWMRELLKINNRDGTILSFSKWLQCVNKRFYQST